MFVSTLHAQNFENKFHWNEIFRSRSSLTSHLTHKILCHTDARLPPLLYSDGIEACSNWWWTRFTLRLKTCTTLFQSALEYTWVHSNAISAPVKEIVHNLHKWSLQYIPSPGASLGNSLPPCHAEVINVLFTICSAPGVSRR